MQMYQMYQMYPTVNIGLPRPWVDGQELRLHPRPRLRPRPPRLHPPSSHILSPRLRSVLRH